MAGGEGNACIGERRRANEQGRSGICHQDAVISHGRIAARGAASGKAP